MIFQEGSIFHIYNRGCDKNQIFYNTDNYRYLLKRIQRTYRKYKISIIAFCLMPNHYHFLLRQDSEIQISKWLQSLFIGYTLAINKQQNRSGTLFSGRAKSKFIDDDRYLQYLIYYIHNNPVKAGLVCVNEEWEFSNYRECIGLRNKYPFVLELINDIYGSQNEYKIFAENYSSNFKEEGLEKYLF